MRFRTLRTRLLFMGSVLATCAVPASGQTSAGLKAGPAQARFSGSVLERSDWMHGWGVAAFATVRMLDELSFQAELLYIRKGGRVAMTWRDDRVSGTVHIDYVELPLMLRVDLPRDRLLSAHGALGPSAALRVACGFAPEDAPATSPGCTAANGTAVRRFDFNLVGLAGVDMKLSHATIVLEARYHVGLGSIDDVTPSWERSTQTMAFQAGIAVPFGRRHQTATR